MPRPIPILLMVRELGLGGSERQMSLVARQLDRERFEPHVGCLRPAGVRGEELRAAGVPIVQFPVTSFKGPSALVGAGRLAQYVAEHEIKLAHSFDVPMNLFAGPTARACGTPVVLTSQRAHRGLTPGLTRKLLRVTDRIVDAVVVNCEHMRRHLIEDEAVSSNRIELCYNGIDLEVFDSEPRRRPAELADAELVIGVVCALRPEKGLPTLVEAFASVAPLAPGIKLGIVGDGPVKDELRSQAEQLGIGERCVFLAGRGDVSDCLRGIDIFVLPSLSEALSNSLMEAMACGCCAIASRVGGNPELVRDGESGLLFESGNAEGLAAALARVVEDGVLRQRLAGNGTRFIREGFSQQTSIERMEGIYSRLLGTSATR